MSFDLFKAMEQDGFLKPDTQPQEPQTKPFDLFEAMERDGFTQTEAPTQNPYNLPLMAKLSEEQMQGMKRQAERKAQLISDYENFDSREFKPQKLGHITTLPSVTDQARLEYEDEVLQSEKKEAIRRQAGKIREFEFPTFTGDRSSFWDAGVSKDGDFWRHQKATLNQALGGSDDDLAQMVQEKFKLPVYKDKYGFRYTVNPEGGGEKIKDPQTGIEGELQYIDTPEFGVQDAFGVATQGVIYGGPIGKLAKMGGGAIKAGLAAGAAEGILNAGVQSARGMARDGSYTDVDLSEVALSSILGGVGGSVERAYQISKAGGRVPFEAANDLSNIHNSTAAKERISKIGKNAEKHGVDLTLAELAQTKGLRAQQIIADRSPVTEGRFKELYDNRNHQIDNAFTKELDKISDLDDTFAAGQDIYKVSEDELNMKLEARDRRAQKGYDAAFDAAGLVETEKLYDAILDAKARTGAKGGQILAGLQKQLDRSVDAPNLSDVHRQAWADLQDELGKANSMSPKPRYVGALQEVKTAFEDIMDKSTPKYKKARDRYALDSAEIEQFKKSPMGTIGVAAKNGQFKDNITQVGRKILESGDAKRITRFRNQVKNTANGDEVWSNYIRGYISDTWDKANVGHKSDAGVNNIGASKAAGWNAKMFKDIRTDRRLKAMLSPDEYKGLKELGEVFEVAGSTTYRNSETAFIQKEMDSIKYKVPDTLFGLARDAVGGFVENFTSDKAMIKIADQLLSPKGREYLEQIGKGQAKNSEAQALRFLMGASKELIRNRYQD